MPIENIESQMILNFDNERLAEIVEESLKPEIDMDIGQRSNTTLCRIDKSVTITIQAPDTTSMRASINSLLRWISMIQKIHKI